jgi:RimJ/RimL family protein N-acetyltransferase
LDSSISTPRLELVPMTPEFLRASIDGSIDRAESLLRASLPEGWPCIPSLLRLRLGQLEADPTLQPWLLRAMRLRSTNSMIGHIGFHTRPGAPYLKEWSVAGVEFGCTVFPAYRRQGYAREASLRLMRWAKDVHDVPEFVVTIGRDNEPSKALFSGLGFVPVGSHVDEVDGLEDIFIRTSRDVSNQ